MTGTATDLRAVLRRDTADAHARLDVLVTRLDLTDRADYLTFLQIHAAVLLPLERWLADNGVAEVLPDWPSRARSAALLDDLHRLGAQPARPAMPMADGALSFDNARAVKSGIVYVLEGSRLGGRLLFKQVQSAADLPAAFLNHGVDQKLWASFTQWLACQPDDEAFMAEATAAAGEVFRLYEEQAARRLAPSGEGSKT